MQHDRGSYRFLRLCCGIRGEDGMERFIFWIKRHFYGKDHYCRYFGVTCEYYEKCREDGGINERPGD